MTILKGTMRQAVEVQRKIFIREFKQVLENMHLKVIYNEEHHQWLLYHGDLDLEIDYEELKD